MRKLIDWRMLVFGLLVALLQPVALQGQGQLLWDNGPYFNSAGTGAGGADESVLYNLSLGMALIAHGTNGSRLADDFQIGDCAWRLDSIAIYGYQVASGNIPTITSVNWRIWDGRPGDVGSSVIFGDSVTNRLVAARWSGAYRVGESTLGSPTRPIMRLVLDMGGLVLRTGDYWIDWAAEGTAGGCWFAPRTPPGQSTTGNAMHFTAGSWIPSRDNFGTMEFQGQPFMVYGEINALTAEAGPNRSICIGDSTVLGGTPTITGGNGPLTLQWSPSAGLSSTTSTNPSATPTVNTAYFLTAIDSMGCESFDTVVVAIGARSANLLIPDTTVCAGTFLTLDAGPAQSYLWSTSATTQTQVAGAGVYYVDVDYGTGCLSTDTVVIQVPAPVSISGDSTPCEGAQVLVCAPANFASYVWTSGETNACVSTTSTGVVALTAIDHFGCTSSDSLSITFYPTPNVNFTYTVTGGGLTYNFINISTNAATWYWDFGDGDTSIQLNPTHTYATHGSYTVQLTVTNPCGAEILWFPITTVGIEGELPIEVVLSPQPATDYLRLQATGLQSGELDVVMTDLQGRQLRNWAFADLGGGIDERLEIGNLAQGMYMLILRQGDLATVRKVVIAH